MRRSIVLLFSVKMIPGQYYGMAQYNFFCLSLDECLGVMGAMQGHENEGGRNVFQTTYQCQRSAATALAHNIQSHRMRDTRK